MSGPVIATRLRVAESFLSLQGEGPTAGTPAHFLRLQGCDVGCRWCDSKYTWDAGGGEALPLDRVLASLRELGEAPLLVVTGGEPLAHEGVRELLAAAIGLWPRVEVETSGLLPPPFVHARLAYNCSPKLPSATERWGETWAHASAFAADPNTTFKLVVGGDPDTADALRLLAWAGLPRRRVVLMPEGMTDAAVRDHALALAEVCKREGLRFGSRLHVWLWGARRGV